LDVPRLKDSDGAIPDTYRKWIDMAKGILAKCPQSEVPKKLILVNVNTIVDTYPVRSHFVDRTSSSYYT